MNHKTDVSTLVMAALLGLTSMGCEGPDSQVAPSEPPQQNTAWPSDTDPSTPDPATPDGAPAPGSYLNHLTVDLDPTAGPDLDGDGFGNNALGALFGEIGGLLDKVSVNDELAHAIETGELSLGMVWPGLDPTDLQNPAAFQLSVVDLQDPDGDPTTTAAFTTSLQPGATAPGTPFQGASIINGAFSAGPTPLPLSFPYFGVQLDLKITETQASGTVIADALGIAVPDGSFTGVVDMVSVTDWANDFVLSPGCACLQGSGPLIDVSNGFDSSACVGADSYNSANCTGEAGFIEGMCQFFADSCMIVVPLLAIHADIDTDGDGKADAHSAVIHFEASGAQVDIL